MSSQPTSNLGGHKPWLMRLVPALDWLAPYERKHLPGDDRLAAASTSPSPFPSNQERAS